MWRLTSSTQGHILNQGQVAQGQKMALPPPTCFRLWSLHTCVATTSTLGKGAKARCSEMKKHSPDLLRWLLWGTQKPELAKPSMTQRSCAHDVPSVVDRESESLCHPTSYKRADLITHPQLQLKLWEREPPCILG